MSPRLLRHYTAVATRAALVAGALLARHVGRPLTVQTKRSAIDLVTEIDRASERLIRRLLRRAAPGFGILGEEYGADRPQSGTRWIVDPLDGTNNFVHGLPFFGVSIGLEEDGVMQAGVIYDPMRRECFSAGRGGGAFLNGRRIRVSAATRLASSLVATGFSSRFLRHDQPYLRWFRSVQRHSHGVRRLGSTVLCLAAIAAGRMEGFYEQDLWPWDLAAGMLLVTEAGGRVSNFRGRPVALEHGQLVASNGRIHPELLRRLRVAAPLPPQYR